MNRVSRARDDIGKLAFFIFTSVRSAAGWRQISARRSNPRSALNAGGLSPLAALLKSRRPLSREFRELRNYARRIGDVREHVLIRVCPEYLTGAGHEYQTRGRGDR